MEPEKLHALIEAHLQQYAPAIDEIMNRGVFVDGLAAAILVADWQEKLSQMQAKIQEDTLRFNENLSKNQVSHEKT